MLSNSDEISGESCAEDGEKRKRILLFSVLLMRKHLRVLIMLRMKYVENVQKNTSKLVVTQKNIVKKTARLTRFSKKDKMYTNKTWLSDVDRARNLVKTSRLQDGIRVKRGQEEKP